MKIAIIYSCHFIFRISLREGISVPIKTKAGIFYRFQPLIIITYQHSQLLFCRNRIFQRLRNLCLNLVAQFRIVFQHALHSITSLTNLGIIIAIP